MAENALIHISVRQDYVMMKQTLVKVVSWVNHASTTLNVIEVWLVDLVLFGLTKATACHLVISTLDARMISTVNLAIGAGRSM